MPITVTVPAFSEAYDNELNEFFSVDKDVSLTLEHSLCSVSKWEMKFEIPFMAHDLTPEELFYYVKCMAVDCKITDEDVRRLTPEQFESIGKYINAPATATTFHQWGNKGGHSKKEVITSELIYYWMVSLEIPFECENWHLNRLLTLIRVCGLKNNPKKMGKMETMMSNSKLNAMRRKAMGSKG